MSTPFQICGGSIATGHASVTFSVTAATAAGDALVMAVGIGGTTISVTGVTDTQGNTWSLENSYTASGPSFFAYAATGATKALSTSDSVTVSFSGLTASAGSAVGIDCPGVATPDVNAVASGTSAAPSVSGTPAQSGETALGLFTWSTAGTAGTISSPFTEAAQQHDNTWTTAAYDVGPASGVPLTAAATITSTSWRAILLTFEPSAVAGGLLMATFP